MSTNAIHKCTAIWGGGVGRGEEAEGLFLFRFEIVPS